MPSNNVRSILEYSRRTLVPNAIQSKNIYDIICLTETWLTENVTTGAIFLDKFNIHRIDRQRVSGKSKYGGVRIAINHEIPHYCILSTFKDCLIVKLLIENPVIIACIYCAPKGSKYRWSSKALLSFLCFIRQKQIELSVRNVMITGDINFAQTDWLTLISSDEDEQDFLVALADFNFEQMITGKEKVQLDVKLCYNPVC